MAQQTKSASRGSSANSSTKRATTNARSTTRSRPTSRERPQANTLAQKLKTPALAAGAAAAGLAGGLALAGRAPHKKVLGVRVPAAGAAQSTSQNLAEAAKQIGSFGERLGELANEVRMVREGFAQSRTRSPIEVVLQGLTSRRS